MFGVNQMQSTIREHRDGGHAGGVFSRYNLVKVTGCLTLFTGVTDSGLKHVTVSTKEQFLLLVTKFKLLLV